MPHHMFMWRKSRSKLSWPSAFTWTIICGHLGIVLIVGYRSSNVLLIEVWMMLSGSWLITGCL